MCRPSPLLIASLLAGVALCACTDPYLREGTWHASGVNQDNLRAMLDDPRDMAWGVSQPGSDGQLAAAAVTRLRAGMLKQLPIDSISKVGGGGGGTTNPTPSPATGGTN